MEKKKSRFFSEVFDLAKSALISIVVVVLLTQFVIKPIQIDGFSMQPTLLDHQRGFSNILAHAFTTIERFEIVIIYDDQDQDYFVKRVIGLAGETIEFKNDRLYINGEVVQQDFLDQDYIDSVTEGGHRMFTGDFGPLTIEQGYVFVMGDNRINSTDSRHRGPYPATNIISKHVYIIYPFNQIRFIHK